MKKEGASKIFLIDRDGDDGEEHTQGNLRKRSRDSTSKGGESTAHPLTEKEMK